MERDGDHGYIAKSLEMPTVFAKGKTVSDCFTSIMDALKAAVAMRLQAGKLPPRTGELLLNEHLNFRATSEERLLIEAAAKRSGSEAFRTTYDTFSSSSSECSAVTAAGVFIVLRHARAS